MFETLQRPGTAVDVCARTIRTRILKGDIAVGTRLPAERRLAESFAVNRVTVRGALAQLAKERLLSVRQGSGYVVCDYRLEGGPELLAGLALLADEQGELASIVADLLLVRRHLARAVLERLAAGRVRSKPIINAVDQFERVIDEGGSLEEIAEADLGIVSALLAATGSAVLGLCMNPVARIVRDMPELRETIYADPASNLLGWRMMCGWLEYPAKRRRVSQIDTIMRALEERDASSVARLKRKATRTRR